jgi:hypothetical protein
VIHLVKGHFLHYHSRVTLKTRLSLRIVTNSIIGKKIHFSNRLRKTGKNLTSTWEENII